MKKFSSIVYLIHGSNLILAFDVIVVISHQEESATASTHSGLFVKFNFANHNIEYASNI